MLWVGIIGPEQRGREWRWPCAGRCDPWMWRLAEVGAPMGRDGCHANSRQDRAA